MINVATTRCVIKHFDHDLDARNFRMMNHQSRCLAAATQAGAQIGRTHRVDGEAGDLKHILRLREACVRNQSCQKENEFAHDVISGFKRRALELPLSSQSNQLLLKDIRLI